MTVGIRKCLWNEGPILCMCTVPLVEAPSHTHTHTHTHPIGLHNISNKLPSWELAGLAAPVK